MRRCHQRPLPQRAFFLLTGLLTVFCAGCCGYESLLSGGDSGDVSDTLHAVVAVASIGSMQDASPAHGDCGCGCQSCRFSITFAFRPIQPATVADSPAFGIGSVSSEHFTPPLVPPPQAA